MFEMLKTEESLTKFCQKIKYENELKPNFPAYIIIVYRMKNLKLLSKIIQELDVETEKLNTIIYESIENSNVLELNSLLKNASQKQLKEYANTSNEKVRKFIENKIQDNYMILSYLNIPVVLKNAKIKMEEYYGNLVDFEDLSEKQKIRIVEKLLDDFEIATV